MKQQKKKWLAGLSLLMLAGLIAGCPQPVDDDPGHVKVTDVSLQADGTEITNLVYPIWEPADTDSRHPKSVQLSAVITPSNATDKKAAWSSSDTAVAQVSDTGLVTGVAHGRTTITVTTNDGNYSVYCLIDVMEAGMELVPVTGVSIKLNGAAVTDHSMFINDTEQLTAEVSPLTATVTEVIWTSSDETAATVSATGLVTALKEGGSATITVTTLSLQEDKTPATASFNITMVFKRPNWTAPAGYLNNPLDKGDPVYFYGTYIMYQNERIDLGPKAIYIDGSLSDELVAQHQYVYNDFMLAVSSSTDPLPPGYVEAGKTGKGALVNGTGENDRMRVLIAPWVYWCDSLGYKNPAIATDGVGAGIWGMRFSCDWLSLEGLNDNGINVILAGNRGQSHGSNGNWTLFNHSGSGELYLEDITIANYCCLDLEYPLNPSLSYPRRTSTATQSQLYSYNGSRVLAFRSNFISRLNLMPPSATRTLYVDCHFESTDDSLPGGAGVVYLNCDLDFYSNKPHGGVSGVVYLNCEFRSHIGYSDTQGQFISKGDGDAAIIDGKFFHDNPDMKIGWNLNPSTTRRNYQYNVTLNGNPVTMSADKPGVSVKIENYPKLLKAYKFTYNGEAVYNTYNLLRGNDEWDPMNIKDKVAAASAQDADGMDLGRIPRRMAASVNPASLTYNAASPPTATTNYTVTQTVASAPTDNDYAGNIVWSIFSGTEGATIQDGIPESNRATVTANNRGYVNIPVIVEAVSTLGLHAAAAITSIPQQITAPEFSADPAITLANGKLTVNYTYNSPNPNIVDTANITWYRAENASGANRIPVMVSRLDVPEKVYTLTAGDIGHHIQVEVTPKFQISPAGTMKSASYASAIAAANVSNTKIINIDFKNFPGTGQPVLKAGSWTLDAWRPYVGYQPAEFNRNTTQQNFAPASITNSTTVVDYILSTQSGMPSLYGAVNGTRGGRLMYTPVSGSYGDMSLTVEAATEKDAGQGFGSADQYMDFMIKYDTAANSGYGLRIERIGASGSATVINLIKYDNVVSASEEPDGTAALAHTPRITYLTQTGYWTMGQDSNFVKLFGTFCTIELKTEGKKLSAKVSRTGTSRDGAEKEGTESYLPLNLEYTHDDIGASTFGGVMINNTGTISAGNRTGLRYLDLEWK
jgi:hypothetical protein